MTTATRPNIYAKLAKIVYFLGIDDCGPVEDGGGFCPHCGANGRYIYNFVCDDGTKHGAMKGCLSKFPMHPFAKIHARILEKQKENAKKGWKLASWDERTLEAIEKFAHNEIAEYEAQRIINSANEAKRAYMKRRGYR